MAIGRLLYIAYVQQRECTILSKNSICYATTYVRTYRTLEIRMFLQFQSYQKIKINLTSTDVRTIFWISVGTVPYRTFSSANILLHNSFYEHCCDCVMQPGFNPPKNQYVYYVRTCVHYILID